MYDPWGACRSDGCLGRYLRKMLCPLLTLRVSREEVGGLHEDSGSKPASVSEGHVIARQVDPVGYMKWRCLS